MARVYDASTSRRIGPEVVYSADMEVLVSITWHVRSSAGVLCLLAGSLSFGSLACGASQPVSPELRATSAPAPAPPAPESATFEFHSGFWLNLHQRLHYQATGRRPAPPGTPPPPDDPAWSAAVEFYKSRFAAKGGFGIVFDDELVALNRQLSALGSAPKLTGVEAELAKHLEAVAAITRTDWPAEDRANQAWIAALNASIARHGAAIQAESVAAYQAPWPSGPIRVDVSRFAGPVGAYTVLEPVHITISSGNPGYVGDGALEMIFHEAAHALIDDPIGKKLEAEAARRGRKAPRDLWHGVLFYSTGEIVKRQLGPDYVPYAVKNGLWERWNGFEPALRKDWQPYLDGHVDMDTAIGALVESVPPDAEDPNR